MALAIGGGGVKVYRLRQSAVVFILGSSTRTRPEQDGSTPAGRSQLLSPLAPKVKHYLRSYRKP